MLIHTILSVDSALDIKQKTAFNKVVLLGDVKEYWTEVADTYQHRVDLAYKYVSLSFLCCLAVVVS